MGSPNAFALRVAPLPVVCKNRPDSKRSPPRASRAANFSRMKELFTCDRLAAPSRRPSSLAAGAFAAGALA